MEVNQKYNVSFFFGWNSFLQKGRKVASVPAPPLACNVSHCFISQLFSDQNIDRNLDPAPIRVIQIPLRQQDLREKEFPQIRIVVTYPPTIIRCNCQSVRKARMNVIEFIETFWGD